VAITQSFTPNDSIKRDLSRVFRICRIARSGAPADQKEFNGQAIVTQDPERLHQIRSAFAQLRKPK
jgi:hypothetical protein